jgi:[ribosomal protein S5]-alanine N-acetyltransferase
VHHLDSSETVLDTPRLRLRRITAADAAFMLRLLNEPSFLQNIGDRHVRTLEDACAYIAKGPQASYETHGFGLYMMELKESGEAIGICGLLKRESLPDADVGYALTPEFWSRGFASEAVAGVLTHAAETFALKRVLAVVNAENAASIRVLEKQGFRRRGTIRMTTGEPELQLLVRDL